MFLTKFKSSFTNLSLNALKYIKSVSQTALLYKPQAISDLNQQQNFKDRVVQAFFDTSKIYIKVKQAQNRLPKVQQFSTPAHSFYQIHIPFTQNINLRKKMTQFTNNHVRIGRLLQIMDYIAANVAYRYCTPDCQKDLDMNQLDFIIVTAAIDSIDFFYPISIQVDCVLSGYVSFVGKSSMQVHIDVLQKVDNIQRLACSANFVMVARHKNDGKAYSVPPLLIKQQKQTFKIINELGAQRQTIRKQQSSRALQFAPPTYEQSIIVHKLKQQLKKQTGNFVTISSSIIKNTMLMHVQDKNLSGKVFGGMILRVCYELGWLCAAKFLKNGYPVITHVDEVQFLAPVQIGTYIQLEAKIGYVTDKFIHVIINCSNSNMNGKNVLTNVLRVTFQHKIQQKQLLKVYPESLNESYIYIQSLRRVAKLQKNHV